MRITPMLGDPPKKNRIRVSRSEIDSFLDKKKLPITKRNIKRARARLRKRKERQSIPRGKDLSFSGTDAPRQIIYGKMQVSGLLTCVSTTDGNNQANMIVAIAGHEIEAVDKMFLDAHEITLGLGSAISPADPRWAIGGTAPDGTSINYDSLAFLSVSTGSDSQAANADAQGQMGDIWTSNHRMRGCAHAFVLLRYNGTIFPDSIPEIYFEVRGKKVYDPRTTLTAYSNNAALCIADHLMDQRYGLGFSLSDINTGTGPGGLQWAANICDEAVNLKGGGTEPRYTCNGVFDADMSHDEILEDLVSSFGGTVNFIGGKWHFWPAKYTAPTVTLTEANLRGFPVIETNTPIKDSFNAIRGTFVSADNRYEVTDLPPIVNSTFISEDNGVTSYEDISLPCTTSHPTGQRLLMIELLRNRDGVTFRASFDLKPFQLLPGNTVALTLSRYGWTSKPFLIEDLELYRDTRSGELITELFLKEISTTFADWDETTNEQDVTTASNTSLPSPFIVQPPSDLLLESGTEFLTVQGDGTIVSHMKFSWTAADPFVEDGGSYEVQYKSSTSGTWIDFQDLSGGATSVLIPLLRDGLFYDARIRARNSIGQLSAWVEKRNHYLVGKLEPPAAPTGLTSSINNFGIVLDWDDNTEPDFKFYQLRYGSTSDTWDTATPLTTISASSYTWNIQTAGTYRVFIKARDTSGNYSSVTYTDVTISAASAPTNFSYELSGENFVLKWDAVTPAQFEIRRYIIKYGPTYAGATEIGAISGTRFEYRGQWSGARTFYVVAEDVAGNEGSVANQTINIAAPGVVTSFTAQNVDNNIKIDWEVPSSGTLPIVKYKVYEGATFGAATKIAEVNGTFYTSFETESGTNTYWVTAVDSAGNEGGELSKTLAVGNPPDFILRDDSTLDLSNLDTDTNFYYDSDLGVLLGSIDVTETVDDFFTNNSWDTIQDAITAGYGGAWLTPSSGSTGVLEHVIDLGVTVSGSVIQLILNANWIEGSGTVATDISVSNTSDTGPWTDYTDISQVYATDFRYVKIRIEADGTNDQALLEVSEIRVKVLVKKQTENGSGTANSGDAGGTSFSFENTFLAVNDITINPTGGVAAFGYAIDYDGANPTTYKVFLFDKDGTRVTDTFTSTISGSISTV